MRKYTKLRFKEFKFKKYKIRNTHGSLSKYANGNLLIEEENAYENAMVDKHKNSQI